MLKLFIFSFIHIFNAHSRSQDNPRANRVLDEDAWESSFWDNINLPQFDGANDFGTPKKQIMRQTRSTSIASPRGSSLKSKLAKYTPLDVEIHKSPKNSKFNLSIASQLKDCFKKITLFLIK